MRQYLKHLGAMKDLCEDFRKEIIKGCFTDDKTQQIHSEPIDICYCWFPIYQSYWEFIRDIVDICDMFGIESLDTDRSELVKYIWYLNNPSAVNTRELFEDYLNLIKEAFSRAEKEISNKLELLNEEEKNRLNEALNCYIEGCNYSAITMSVSAIEYRLLSLMRSKCINGDLEELTLGQLIREYLDNKGKYGNIIPKKHEPLLEHCNTYRIFSVHPKRENISRPIATSIINMAFSFLLDEGLKQEAEK